MSGPLLKQMVQDASAYYLLGYAPVLTPVDGKFHKIDVKVRRKGVRALARHGYWAPRPEELLSVGVSGGDLPPCFIQSVPVTSLQEDFTFGVDCYDEYGGVIQLDDTIGQRLAVMIEYLVPSDTNPRCFIYLFR